MADIRLTDLPLAALLAADDRLEIDGATNGSRSLAATLLTAMRNASSQSGGVVFRKVPGAFGSRDCGVNRAITVSIKPCFSIRAQVPRQTISASRGIFGWSDTAGDCLRAGALAMWLDSSGYLVARFYGATTSDWRQLRTPFVGNYPADSEPLIHWDLRAGKLYIDAADTAAAETTGGTAPAWSDAVTGTVLTLAAVSSTTPWQGKLSKFARWNFQASATDRMSCWFLGGDVPPHRQYGSNANLNAGTGNVLNFGANDGASVPTTGFGSAPASAQSGAWSDGVNSGAGSRFLRISGTSFDGYGPNAQIATMTLVPGAQFEIGFWSRKSGTLPVLSLILRTTGGGLDTITGGNITPTTGSSWAGFDFGPQVGTSWSRVSQVFTVNGPTTYNLALFLMFGFESASGGSYWDIDDIEILVHGVDIFLPMDEGIGYQFHDVGPGALDVYADPTFTPVPYIHAVPRKSGYLRGTLTWAGVSDTKDIFTGIAVPTGIVTTLLTMRLTGAAATGPNAGTSNNASSLVAASAFTAGQKKSFTPVSPIAAGTATGDRNRRITPNGASAYTGNIDYEEHYTATLGTP